MADFLRNIYEVPDEYTRAQALEQQEYARRQRQLFDLPRAMG
ncbi:MAG: hypothetical protein KatS3mg083_253 [Candidatus Dojkabacteria bacterium]|nr:MAG: hypothetical protein KatS3mg083_253 [Candidatus Dojkabacteria bacterium]